MPIASRALNRLGPSGRDDGDRQQQRREGEEDVHEAHERCCRSSPTCSRRARRCVDPMKIAKPIAASPITQRRPGAEDHAAEHVAEVAVGAEEVLRLVRRAAEQVDARRGPLLDARLDAEQRLVRVVGARSASAKTATKTRNAEDDQPDDGGALAQDAAQRVAPQAATCARRRRRRRSPSGSTRRPGASDAVDSSRPDPRVEEAVRDVDDRFTTT